VLGVSRGINLLIEATKILETAQAPSFKKIIEEEIKESGDRTTVETNILIGFRAVPVFRFEDTKARQQ